MGVAVPSGLAKKPASKAAATHSTQHDSSGASAAEGPAEKANLALVDKWYQDAKKKFESGTIRGGMSEEEKEQCKRNTIEAHGLFLQILKSTGGADYRCTKEYVTNCKKLISMRGPSITYNQISADDETGTPHALKGGGESDSVAKEDVVMDEWDSPQRIRSDEVFQSEIIYCQEMCEKLKGTSSLAEWEVCTCPSLCLRAHVYISVCLFVPLFVY